MVEKNDSGLPKALAPTFSEVNKYKSKGINAYLGKFEGEIQFVSYLYRFEHKNIISPSGPT
jgi:hypothetical protein